MWQGMLGLTIASRHASASREATSTTRVGMRRVRSRYPKMWMGRDLRLSANAPRSVEFGYDDCGDQKSSSRLSAPSLRVASVLSQ